MKLEACGENCFAELQMWSNFWVIESCLLFALCFCFILSFPTEYTYVKKTKTFTLAAWIRHDCLPMNVTLMSYTCGKNKLLSLSVLIIVLFSSYWRSPLFSVFLQLRWLLRIRTQWGIIWFIRWVTDLFFCIFTLFIIFFVSFVRTMSIFFSWLCPAGFSSVATLPRKSCALKMRKVWIVKCIEF